MSDPSLSYIQPHPSPIHSSPDTKPRHLSSLHFQDCRPIPDPHTPSKPAGTTSPPPKEMLPPSDRPLYLLCHAKFLPSFPPILPNISNKYFTFLLSLLFFPIHRDEPARSEPPFIYLCTHLEHRCPNRADAVRHGRTSVVKASEQRYIERAVRTSWARPVIFTTMCKKPPLTALKPPEEAFSSSRTKSLLLLIMMLLLQHHILYLHQADLRASLIFHPASS